MIDYPKEFPTEAAHVVFNVATNGFAPDGEHGDASCFYQALWNIQGFGLGVWKPHVHELKANQAPKPSKLGRFAPPRTESAQIKALAKALEPIKGQVEAANPPEGTEDPAAPTLKEAIDWSKIPWEQVLMLVTFLLQTLLKKQPK